MKKKYLEIPLFFLAGSVLYPLIEILYRGYTHISMSLLGGICFCAIRLVDLALGNGKILLKALICSIIITQLEFICGVIVNIGMGLAVWDYSHLPFNLVGQICPLFTFFWFLLTLPYFLLKTYFLSRKKVGKESFRPIEDKKRI